MMVITYFFWTRTTGSTDQALYRKFGWQFDNISLYVRYVAYTVPYNHSPITFCNSQAQLRFCVDFSRMSTEIGFGVPRI